MSKYAVEPFELLDRDLLANVSGGNDPGYRPDDNARGRVGPGRRMRFLGDYYTPEALAHDNAVREGGGGAMAHVKALPLLPAAAKSWFRARFNPGPQDRHIPQ